MFLFNHEISEVHKIVLAETSSVDIYHWPIGCTCPFFSMIAIIVCHQQVFTFFLMISEKKVANEQTFSLQKKLMVKSQMQSDMSSCLNMQSSCRSNLAWVKPAEYLHDYVKHFKSKFTSNQKT